VTGLPERELSSLELLLQGKGKPVEGIRLPLRAGMICPACEHGRLDYNGLLALECPACGFTSNEGGGCT
jgi:hypothetical protein